MAVPLLLHQKVEHLVQVPLHRPHVAALVCLRGPQRGLECSQLLFPSLQEVFKLVNGTMFTRLQCGSSARCHHCHGNTGSGVATLTNTGILCRSNICQFMEVSNVSCTHITEFKFLLALLGIGMCPPTVDLEEFFTCTLLSFQDNKVMELLCIQTCH